MDFIKNEDAKIRDHVLQNDTPTKPINVFMAVVLVLLIIGIVVTGFYFEWF